MAARFKFRSQLREVIDFAVEYHPKVVVLVVDRLVPCRQVDDAQPPHSQPGAAVRVNPLIVRPAVHDCLTHPMDVHGLSLVAGFNACYAAHTFRQLGITTNPLALAPLLVLNKQPICTSYRPWSPKPRPQRTTLGHRLRRDNPSGDGADSSVAISYPHRIRTNKRRNSPPPRRGSAPHQGDSSREIPAMSSGPDREPSLPRELQRSLHRIIQPVLPRRTRREPVARPI